MAITLNTDLLVSAGKLTNVELIQGAWRTVDTAATMNALTGSANEEAKLEVGQIFYVEDEDKLYKYRLVGSGFFATKEFQEFEFPSSGGGSTPNGTISGSQQISDLGFLSSDATSSFVLVDDSSSFFQSMSFDDSTNLLSIEGGNSVDLSPLTGSGGGSGTGIFALTGSVYSTTNDLQITGSFTVGDGLFRLKEFTTTPTAEEGAIYYSASNFYFGVE